MNEQELRTIRTTGLSYISEQDLGLNFLGLSQYLASGASLSKFKREIGKEKGYLDLIYSTVQRMKHCNRCRYPVTDEIEIMPDYPCSRPEVDITYRTDQSAEEQRDELEAAFYAMLEKDVEALLEETAVRSRQPSEAELRDYRQRININVKEK